MPVTLELAREIVSVARNIGIVTDTNDIKAGDNLEVFEVEERERTL